MKLGRIQEMGWISVSLLRTGNGSQTLLKLRLQRSMSAVLVSAYAKVEME
jgi:hypothetical protein